MMTGTARATSTIAAGSGVRVLECSVRSCGGSGLFILGGVHVTVEGGEYMRNKGFGLLAKDAGSQLLVHDVSVCGNGMDGVSAQKGARVTAEGGEYMGNNEYGFYVSGAGSRLTAREIKVSENLLGDVYEVEGGEATLSGRNRYVCKLRWWCMLPLQVVYICSSHVPSVDAVVTNCSK